MEEPVISQDRVQQCFVDNIDLVVAKAVGDARPPGFAKYSAATAATVVDKSRSRFLKLGLQGLRSAVAAVLIVSPTVSTLVMLKFGLQRLQSTGPRQNSNSQSFLVLRFSPRTGFKVTEQLVDVPKVV